MGCIGLDRMFKANLKDVFKMDRQIGGETNSDHVSKTNLQYLRKMHRLIDYNNSNHMDKTHLACISLCVLSLLISPRDEGLGKRLLRVWVYRIDSSWV